jgi:hypothetical protein
LIERAAYTFENLRSGQARQNRLNADALAGYFRMNGLCQIENEGLGGAVGAVEALRNVGDHRGDIDDRSPAPCSKRLRRRNSQTIDRNHVQLDHGVQIVGIVIKQCTLGTDAGVVDKQGDAFVVSQPRLDGSHCRPVRKISGQDAYFNSGLPRQFFRQRPQPLRIARNEDQIVAALGETVGIGGADAGRGTGDEGSSKGARHGRIP